MTDEKHDDAFEPVEIKLDVIKEFRTEINQKLFPLNCFLSVENLTPELEKLTVAVSYSETDFESYEHSFSSGRTESDSKYQLELPPVTHSGKNRFVLSKEQLLSVNVILHADGEEIAAKSRTIKLLPPAELSVDAASVYSIVFQQNQFPLISKLELTNRSANSFGLTKVVAEFDPPDFEATEWVIDEVVAGQSVSLKERMLKLSAKTLEDLTEKRLIQLKLSVFTSDVLVCQTTQDITLLPKNHWGGELHMPELLAAFVTPNTHYCDALLKKASNLLAKDGHDSQLDGYQSNTRERPYMIAAALWSVVCNEGISYCVPPASFAAGGQKIRLCSDISQSLLSTCLDTALLFASCLEQAGLNSVVALTKGHAMVGVWLVDESFPVLTSDDPIDLRNRIALKDLILFETTLATSHHPIKFSQAILEADRKISEEVEHDFVYVLDVKQARSRKINPINIREESGQVEAEGTEKSDVELPPLPVLPPIVDQDTAEVELGPAGRIDLWRRKLLDLTKRNKLLNIRQKSMGFRILSPDLGFLEDQLAAGKKYNVISRESLTTDGRSSDQFTQQTGNNLEAEFVIDQLHRGSLIADCNDRELEKNLINLFRRAKSDLEEGGSNTLFLAIGMLRWKEDARSEQSYRAPLILLPVKLERTSARAKPKLRQLSDEDPVFNLTLIEFLQQDFEIDLSIFQSDLPEDESGIDIDGIWKTVRSKIKDTPGFEVVEELVLSNFSFAKYLMWKDLSDRVEDLRSSPFVDHLIENPAVPYPHRAEFINAHEVDEKIAPEKLFAPLNADSAQIVAIDASARGVDFVLEGPPGTGKSETIANIISHNIASGRKVLFVSEKMAALDVVYSRLKKVGLGHLCLELHSNKVSKRAVIDQLGEAWSTRENMTKEAWEENARKLVALRKDLNQYVEHLHANSALGYSARDAIARSTLYGDTCRVDLGWAMDLMTAPVQTKEDVKQIVGIVENLGLAFKDIDKGALDSFAFISTPDWSNLWQVELLHKAKDLDAKSISFSKSLIAFVSLFSGQLKNAPSQRSATCWQGLANIVIAAVERPHDFSLSENAKGLIDGLAHLATLKKRYDVSCQSISFDGEPAAISKLPLQEWNSSRIDLYEKGSLSARYVNDTSILHKFKLEGLSLDVEKSEEVVALCKEIADLANNALCPLEGETLVSLPISNWLQRHHQKHSSKVDEFESDKGLLSELSNSGFNVSSHAVAEKTTGLDSLQDKAEELLAKCNCSLGPESIIALPRSEWLKMGDAAAEKNGLTQFFVKQKINKQMKKKGLNKIAEFDELQVYEQLVETFVQMQKIMIDNILESTQNLITKTEYMQRLITDHILRVYGDLSELVAELTKLYSLYNGDGILDDWSTSPEEILERKAYGSSVRSSLVSIANQLDAPETFMENIRLQLIDRREFLESSELLKQAELLLHVSREFEESVSDFEKCASSYEMADISLEKLNAYLCELQKSSHSLNAWCHWTDAKNKAISCGAVSVVSGLETGLINWNETVDQFKTALCIWLSPLLVDLSEVLRNFSATKHGSLIDKFRSLDEEVANTTGQFIAAKLASEMPDTSGPNAPHEYGVLSRELQKKARHKPVRQLIQELGEYLLSLTPCFMMSPLSVAQFLPSDYKAFDLVVFDEASQITVWDAVGAIARGKNVIVVGDPKQMPPTNFFNRSQEMDDSDEADLESILDQAMAARVSYHRLTGHYRSRHESLITFSNHQYYQNSLTTYPCADTRDSAVSLHRVDGVYTKGQARNNPIEAQALVAEVVRRLKDLQLQKLSIGIVTFNTEQQRLIEDLLDAERRSDTSLERFFNEDANEPVFVKNLETVQGDQRDVICLSVGYGPSEPEAQTMSMNFGPLNRQGGERRLNVAITRASTEMLVFASFDSTMIDLSRTSSEAVKDLKAYIDYAARGPIALAQRSTFNNHEDQFDSCFEEAVALRLRGKGWDIRTQIGVSKFRIDLGVLNPDSPGSFLAGIECDGASYHSSPSARDRDRVRHIILENLGWNLVRIWSTDFFINPEKIIEHIHEKLNSLVADFRGREKLKQIEVDGIEGLDDEVDLIFEESAKIKVGELGAEGLPQDAEIEDVSVRYSSGVSVSTSYISEYKIYHGGELEDPRTADSEVISYDLIQIIDVEGPMLVKRAYDIYLRHCGIKRMGNDLKKLMNQALKESIDKGYLIKDDEWNVEDLLGAIVRVSTQPCPRLRRSGGRTIDEIPPSEIRAISALILEKNDVVSGSEEHFRLVLGMYDFKRLTKHTGEVLREVIR